MDIDKFKQNKYGAFASKYKIVLGISLMLSLCIALAPRDYTQDLKKTEGEIKTIENRLAAKQADYKAKVKTESKAEIDKLKADGLIIGSKQ